MIGLLWIPFKLKPKPPMSSHLFHSVRKVPLRVLDPAVDGVLF